MALIFFKLKIINGIESLNLKNTVATLGIFDGVHKAHQAILQRMREIARQNNGETVVVTLWPHPRIVLSHEKASLHLINTLEEKIERLEQEGIDNLVILEFDKTMASTGFDDFVEKYLVNYLNVQWLVVGYNHQFGKNREGNFAKLSELSAQYGFELEQMNPVFIGDEKVSSSSIRKLLLEGRVSQAEKLLGVHYSVYARVIHGTQLGRNIGFPTANLATDESAKLMPGNGVYAVQVEFEGKIYQAMMNIGSRPTVENNKFHIVPEVHIFDLKEDLYGKYLRVIFCERIRNEQRFNSVDELRIQLQKDKETIIQYFEHKP